jgi:hypothetical protein
VQVLAAATNPAGWASVVATPTRPSVVMVAVTHGEVHRGAAVDRTHCCPIDVDHRVRGYHKEYREPVRMLLLQQRAEIYHNVFEQLKNSTDPRPRQQT